VAHDEFVFEPFFNGLLEREHCGLIRRSGDIIVSNMVEPFIATGEIHHHFPITREGLRILNPKSNLVSPDFHHCDRDVITQNQTFVRGESHVLH